MGRERMKIHGYFFYTCGHMRPDFRPSPPEAYRFFKAWWPCWKCESAVFQEKQKCSPAP